MQYRTFGRTGWQVSDIGYGMWGIGGWTGSDDEESLRSLHRAVELGCNFFDTACGTRADSKITRPSLGSPTDKMVAITNQYWSL